MADSNPAFGLTAANAKSALELPPGAVRAEVAGTGVLGADVRFYAADGTLVLRRELKATGNILDKKTGNIVNTTYSAFNDRISEAASQAQQAGEIWLQVNSGAKVEDYLRRFNAVPGRDMAKYKDMTLHVVDELGTVIYHGPVKK